MEPDQWADLVGRHVVEARGAEARTSIAKRAGLGQSVWRQIETGQRQVAPGVRIAPSPTAETCYAVAEVLGWPRRAIAWLLEGDDPSWWEGEQVADGVARWTRHRPDGPPVVVTEPTHSTRRAPRGRHRTSEPAPDVSMGWAVEAHEEVVRLKVRVENLEAKVDFLLQHTGQADFRL